MAVILFTEDDLHEAAIALIDAQGDRRSDFESQEEWDAALEGCKNDIEAVFGQLGGHYISRDDEEEFRDWLSEPENAKNWNAAIEEARR